MRPVISAFARSPDEGHGHSRDFRVRWALEEVGEAYDVNGLSFEELKKPSHRAIHPFGKIPTYDDGQIQMFESGAIVLRIGETHGKILPENANARTRAVMWMFAALSTVEPPIVEREAYMLLERDEPYYEKRLSRLDDAVRERLRELSSYLGASDWLEGEFSVGDIMMVTVLRRLADGPNLLLEFPNLNRYVRRGEDRAAFKRALDAERGDYLDGIDGSSAPSC